MNFYKIKQFIAYNNAMVILAASLFVVGGSVLAAPAGREALGGPNERLVGVDNQVLLATDLEKLDMAYRIEKIEEDNENYYVTYTFNDLIIKDQLWLREVLEKTRAISKRGMLKDLGEYMTGQLVEEHDTRLMELADAKLKAQKTGPEKRILVKEYTGMVGKTLDLAAELIPGYEPVKKTELPVPETEVQKAKEEATAVHSDNMNTVYQEYLTTHPEVMEDLHSNGAITAPEANLGPDAVVSEDVVIPPATEKNEVIQLDNSANTTN